MDNQDFGFTLLVCEIFTGTGKSKIYDMC